LTFAPKPANSSLRLTCGRLLTNPFLGRRRLLPLQTTMCWTQAIRFNSTSGTGMRILCSLTHVLSSLHQFDEGVVDSACARKLEQLQQIIMEQVCCRVYFVFLVVVLMGRGGWGMSGIVLIFCQTATRGGGAKICRRCQKIQRQKVIKLQTSFDNCANTLFFHLDFIVSAAFFPPLQPLHFAL
jgi:hypothetical protein